MSQRRADRVRPVEQLASVEGAPLELGLAELEAVVGGLPGTDLSGLLQEYSNPVYDESVPNGPAYDGGIRSFYPRNNGQDRGIEPASRGGSVES